MLLEHLTKNHPLPDANKRAAFRLTARLLDASGLQWGPPDDEARHTAPPDRHLRHRR